MPDPAAPNPNPGKSKDPNFFAVVIASAVVVLLFFLGTLLFLHHDARHVLPPSPRNHPAASNLTLPAGHSSAS